MRSFVAPSIWGGEPVRFSPDESKFFVVTRNGNIASDTNLYQLHLFDTSSLITRGSKAVAPKLIRTIELESATNDPAISDARWIDEGNEIAFLGVEDNGTPQVFHVDVTSGVVSRRTDVPLGVFAFDLRAGSLIYFARVSRRGDLAPSYYPGAFLDRNYIEFVDTHWIGDTFATFVASNGRQPKQVGKDITYPYPIVWVSYRLSPDGNTSTMTLPIRPSEAPKEWSRYGEVAVSTSAQVNRHYQRFYLVDLESATSKPILDSPTGQAVENDGTVDALWYPDNSKVVLTNVCLPLDRSVTQRRKASYLIELDVRDLSYRVIDNLETSATATLGWPREIRWLQPATKFSVTYRLYDTATIQREYIRHYGKWESRSVTREEIGSRDLANGLVVEVAEDAETAPSLIARVGSNPIALLDPDPALVGVAMSRVESLAWTDNEGNSWLGRISFPRSRSGAVPLVVQVGTGYDFDRFMPEGSSSTAYAAQSLNSVGIAVLRIRMADIVGFGTHEEGPSFVRGFDAVVQELARREVVDAGRVGVLGHSRGGFLTQFAITHPGTVVPCAAIAADAFSGGYFEYMHVEPKSLSSVTYERMYGGKPFWQDPEQWLALAPTFNAHRSQTPILLEPIGLPALIGTQEFYSSLRHNEKAAEILYFPSGEHQLVRPSERITSVVATVDWMAFWLLAQEDNSDQKAEQYRRWRAMRESVCDMQKGQCSARCLN